jgi:hypothetical protein
MARESADQLFKAISRIDILLHTQTSLSNLSFATSSRARSGTFSGVELQEMGNGLDAFKVEVAAGASVGTMLGRLIRNDGYGAEAEKPGNS